MICLCYVLQIIYFSFVYTYDTQTYTSSIFRFNGESEYLILPSGSTIENYFHTQRLAVEVILILDEINRQHSLVEKYGCAGRYLLQR